MSCRSSKRAFIAAALGGVPERPSDWLCCAARLEDVYFLYAPEVGEQLAALPGQSPKDQSSTIQSICSRLRVFVLSDGVVPRDIANPYNMPWFFRLRDEVLKTIGDPAIRSLTW